MHFFVASDIFHVYKLLLFPSRFLSSSLLFHLVNFRSKFDIGISIKAYKTVSVCTLDENNFYLLL